MIFGSNYYVHLDVDDMHPTIGHAVFVARLLKAEQTVHELGKDGQFAAWRQDQDEFRVSAPGGVDDSLVGEVPPEVR